MRRLSSVGRTAGAIGAALGVAAASAAVGFAAERYVVGRSLRGDDPYRDEPLGRLRGTPSVVETDDGVRLYVETDDLPDAAGTVVFIHGYALTSDSWHFQRRDLRGKARLVFFDHRSHGRSSRAPDESEVTFERLATDLSEVLDQAVRPGPVVLVGHSMGGMTVMALAEERPELFGDRVAGVVLVTTSPRDVQPPSIGLPGPAGRLGHRVLPGVVAAAARRPELVERGRRAGSDLGYVLTRRYSFGTERSPALVEFTAAMNATTPIGVVARFLPLFSANDRAAATAALRGVPTVILAAERDRLTPVEDSRELALELPDAAYVEVAGAGHMLPLERHELVTNSIAELIDDLWPGGRPDGG